MKKRFLPLLGFFTTLSGFAAPQPDPARPWLTAPTYDTFPLYASVGYDQPLRPQFHFTSRVGWLNDPNGMLFNEGEWFLAFQHYAKGNANGAKSWGAAVSKDLIHWTQLPHILNPYKNVKYPQGNEHAIWSGSALVDEINALGKQKGDVKTLFGMFTATHAGEDKKAAFFQVGVYSTDKGRTWTMIHDGKPMVDHVEGYDPGQRDPYLFYHAPTKSYRFIMELGGPEKIVRIWKSSDLMNWEPVCDIPNKSAECINMYSVPLDGDKNNLKWVIADAGTSYEVGDFDGTKWTGFGDKDSTGKRLRYDYGDCYYAPQTFNQSPGNRVVHIGWLRSKDSYSPFTEAGLPFTQQLSVPAEITLRTTPEGIRMYRNPVKELSSLYIKTDKFENLTLAEANTKLEALKPELIDMTLAFVPQGDLTLNVRGFAINYDAKRKEFLFTNTGRVEGESAANSKLPPDKQKKYTDNGRRQAPAPEVDGKVKIRVLMDRASMEWFINDGQAAASFVVVPDANNRSISLTGDAATKVTSLEVNELKSCWQ